MGGKVKQAQRTKNNQRPSSSHQAAELLGASVSVPSLFGFSTLDNNLASVVPVSFINIETAGNDDIDPNLDESFQICFRKMSKKDPTTKTKALKEFADLISKTDVEIIKAVLPFWPRYYSNLATDVEHRVRETAQQAQAAVIAKAGKNIAPFLRQMAPAWISSQYDTYAPAASLASQSFKSAFPQNKLKEVFIFCENELIEYFTKNITVHTAITLSNPKTHTPEELEGKYERVLIASLQGYSLFLEKLPEENLRKMSEKHALILDNPKFWSHHKSKVPQIRAAWFEVIAALLQFGKFLTGKYEQQMTTCVFQFMDETDPTVIPHIWSSIILVPMKIGNWHTYLNFEKAVFPKLWKVLKSGSAGNASCVFPQMLPLVSNFKRDILKDKIEKFYCLFFENMNLGLKAVHASRSDISAISQAYYEVLQYIVIQILKDGEFDLAKKEELCTKLLEEHLVAVIEWVIESESSSGKYIFNNIATLLDYWCQHSSDQPMYEKLLKKFWLRLYEVVEKSLTSEKDTEKITNSHIEIVQNLKRTLYKKVKFSTESERETTQLSQEHALRFEVDLQELVYKLCKLYIKKINETSDQKFIFHLEYLMRLFQCVDMFKYLNNDKENIAHLYDQFATWLLNDKLRCEYIVEIILILYKFLNADEKVEILQKCIKLPNKIVQSWIILRALSHPLCQEPNITKLLSQPEVTDNLLECAQSVTNDDLKENLILLHKCFFISDSGSILIDSITCAKIIEKLCEPLTDNTKITSRDTCASFLAQIMPVICSDEKQIGLRDKMFMKLFEFSVKNNTNDFLSDDTIWEVTTAWQDALSSEDLVLSDAMLEACSKILNEEIIMSEFNDENFERFSELTAKLVFCSTETVKREEKIRLDRVDVLLDNILNKEKNEFDSLMKRFGNLAVFVEFLADNLTSKSIEDSVLSLGGRDFDKKFKTLLIVSYFKLNVIFKLSCNVHKKSDEMEKMDEDHEFTEDYCDADDTLITIWSSLIHQQVMSVIYIASISDTLLYNTVALDKTCEHLIISLQEKLSLMLANLSVEIIDKIKEQIFDHSNTKGLLWAKSLPVLLNIDQYSDKENGPVLLYEDVVTVASYDDNMMGYINILQSLAKKMAPGCLPIMPNLFENYFDLLVKISSTRCLIFNHFSGNYNELIDRKIIGNSMIIIHEVITRQKKEPFLLYNCDLTQGDMNRVFLDAQIANLLADVLKFYPTEMDLQRWDFVRIALSSWTLTVSKSHQHYRNQPVAIFISSIFRIYSSFANFIREEKMKSSTELLSNVIEEWENVFAKDVNLVLLKVFMNVVLKSDITYKSEEYFLNAISPHIESLDFSYVLKANKIDAKTTLDDLIKFALDNISHNNHYVRIASATILRKLFPGLIQSDLEAFGKRNDRSMSQDEEAIDDSWHSLYKFHCKIDQFNEPVEGYVNDFNFKISEMDSSEKLDHKQTFSYFLLWDCIVDLCSKSPPELRSIYAAWITRKKYEQTLMPALFKTMPQEILKNPDSGVVFAQTMFSNVDWNSVKSPTMTTEKYACHLYAQTLRFLPAVVRKWWHGTNHRHAAIIEKITTNCVSNVLCQEELQSLVEKREKQENMHVKVHVASKQVTAVYQIDEAKMELIITLPNNYPLGPVKVESGKHIGTKIQSRQVVMLLSIFLTHQNGSISDGLLLWKKNLDRKFEGVEECYVCYSVIHQDTCELPKLSCKTCKKKFHGPCLYRWFRTSNKSTCPICRNIF